MIKIDILPCSVITGKFIIGSDTYGLSNHSALLDKEANLYTPPIGNLINRDKKHVVHF